MYRGGWGDTGLEGKKDGVRQREEEREMREKRKREREGGERERMRKSQELAGGGWLKGWLVRAGGCLMQWLWGGAGGCW